MKQDDTRYTRRSSDRSRLTLARGPPLSDWYLKELRSPWAMSAITGFMTAILGSALIVQVGWHTVAVVVSPTRKFASARAVQCHSFVGPRSRRRLSVGSSQSSSSTFQFRS